MSNLHKMNAGEFARRLRVDSAMPDKRYAFFIGAGCSITSGIPGAGSLVKDHWLPKLQEVCAPDPNDFNIWLKNELPDYDTNNPATSYGAAMEHLFLNPEDRQREIERICEGRFPGFGYAVLATLIAKDAGSFNVVITTNFDDLISDALYLFTRVRPLVIGHESLAGFIRPTRTRPLVIKIHGDARLSPQNTIAETANIQKEVEGQVKALLHDRALIFMGYGGNDSGIAKMLSELPKEALPFGIYWISGSEPQGVLRTWLEQRKAIWVEKFDFDEMMLLIRDAFDLPHPDIKQVESVFQLYGTTYEKLSGRIRSAPREKADASLRKAIKRADNDFTGWIAAALAAKRLEKTDSQKADRIYQEGIKSYPQSASLIGNYAVFLTDIFKEHDKAEQYYQRAIEADPNNANNLSNYANILRNVRKDPNKAEQYYLRAIEADPNNANNLSNYAGFCLMEGNKEKGYPLLDKAISLISESQPRGLSAELWFYAFCHWPEHKRTEALKNLKNVLLIGDRSPNWDMSPNVERARKDGHPDAGWIEILAEVITKDTDPKKLDDWQKWREA